MNSSNTNDLKSILCNELNSVNRNTRQKMAEILKDNLFIPIYDLSIRKQKELALERLKKILSHHVVSVRDFQTNPENIFTMHEMVIN